MARSVLSIASSDKTSSSWSSKLRTSHWFEVADWRRFRNSRRRFGPGPAFPPVSVDVIEAEAALRDGNLDLAADLAARVAHRLPADHPLRSRASAIQGQSNFLLARFELAEAAFVDARRTATDDEDETEGLHGLGLCRTFGERGDIETAARGIVGSSALVAGPSITCGYSRSPDDGLEKASLLRSTSKSRSTRRTRLKIRECERLFYYTAAYALGQQAHYRLAQQWIDRFWTDVREYDLEFARPHVAWTDALIQLGLRRFGET